MSVLVVLEQNAGKWNRMSFEALAAGKTIADALGVRLNAACLVPPLSPSPRKPPLILSPK